MRVCWPQHKHKVITAVLVGLFCLGLYSLNQRLEAATATTSLSPVSDLQTGSWSAQGTGNGTCANALCDRVDEPPSETTPNTSRFIQSQADSSTVRFGLNSFDTERGATSATVRFYVHNAGQNSTADDIRVRLIKPSGNTTQIDVQIANASYEWKEVTFNETFTQEDINNMEVRLEQIRRRGALVVVGGEDTLEIAAVHVNIDYTPFNELNQSAYRVYQNADADSPGAPIAATDTIGDIPGQGSAFRLRMLATVSINDFLTGEFSYRLQVAKKITSCSAATYSDVTASTGPIQFFDNPSVADGASTASSVDDPASPNTITHQSYHESNPIGSDQNAPEGNDILWDVALYDAGTEPNEIYCFRLIYNDGALFENYDSYPEVRAVGDLTVSIVDTDGQIVPGAGITMSPTVVLTECQSTSGTLGTPEQRLQITNDLVTEGWGVSIAATNGPSVLWSAGTPEYDFNDPAGSPSGCAAGLDNDTSAGQMSIDPSSSSITPSDSCSTTGVTAAPATAFDEGGTDIIDLANGSSSSERFCSFYVEDISVEQTIPAEQPMGTYTIDMTLTIVAF